MFTPQTQLPRPGWTDEKVLMTERLSAKERASEQGVAVEAQALPMHTKKEKGGFQVSDCDPSNFPPSPPLISLYRTNHLNKHESLQNSHATAVSTDTRTGQTTVCVCG